MTLIVSSIHIISLFFCTKLYIFFHSDNQRGLVVLFFEVTGILRYIFLHSKKEGATINLSACLSSFDDVLTLVDRNKMGSKRF